MQLTWAENVVRKSNKPVLILTPLAVGAQTLREAHKFGIEASRSQDGTGCSKAHIVITNYERLHYFTPSDFSGVVCDESSILKNFDGVTKSAVTDFMRTLPYRLLCTATAAPNDYIELGTSSEALGELGYMDMLARFFKNAQNSLHPSVYRHRGTDFSKLNEGAKFRFRGHAEHDFWRWICSWSRAIRKPSDIGGDDARFVLPPLETREHIVKAASVREGFLFDLPAIGLQEQREERARTLQQRCEIAAALSSAHKGATVSWCHLNTEGDLLTKLIPDAVQVSGDDSDKRKEEVFEAFAKGEVLKLVTKPSIAGFGLNWFHCCHQTFFPSHSFEQWYQAIRRSWRFGQTKPVIVDVIASEGERGVLKNMQRKSEAADAMFSQLVKLMNDELSIKKIEYGTKTEILPDWMLTKTNVRV